MYGVGQEPVAGNVAGIVAAAACTHSHHPVALGVDRDVEGGTASAHVEIGAVGVGGAYPVVLRLDRHIVAVDGGYVDDVVEIAEVAGIVVVLVAES